MITLALAVALVAQSVPLVPAPQEAQPDTAALDSIYETPAVRDLVERAAAANRRAPADLASYAARVETELSFVRVEADGRETVLQIEQVASDLSWRADGGLLLELIGYRSQMLGVSFSGLSFFDVPWAVPSLYGERLDLVRTGNPTYDEEGRLLVRRAVHPFSSAREDVYRFSGGDTVLTLRLPDRTVPIARVHVEPVQSPERPTLLFEGDIDIDVTRMHVVSMQGRLFVAGRPRSLLDAVAEGVLFVRLESGEYDEAYWLPREQRFEVQAISRLGEGRVVFRAVSRFLGVLPNDPAAAALAPSPDSFPSGRLVGGEDLSGLSAFSDWRLPMGELNASATARDFDRYAPSLARSGAPRLTFGARQVSQLVRFNPVEGVYTGAGLTFDFGDAVPGLRARAHAGWAWREETWRGGAELERRLGDWEYALRAERQLVHTHDFLYGLGVEPDEVSLFGAESFTYLDRRLAGGSVRRFQEGGANLRVEVARVGDRAAGRAPPPLDVTDPELPPPPPSPEEALRSAVEGDYWRARAEVRLNPSAGGFSLRPGLFLRAAYEGATGELDWQKVEAGASFRRRMGRWTLSLGADAGALLSTGAPPQALFELGALAGVPGSDTRVFAGDRAALGRTTVLYTLPLFGGPLRVGSMWLPAPEPSPSVGLRLGWTDASAETLEGMRALSWRTSEGVRSSIDLRLRFFGGGLSVGAARPLERDERWRFVWGLVGAF